MSTQTVKILGDSTTFAHRNFNGIWQADGINDVAVTQNPVTDSLISQAPKTVSFWVKNIPNIGGNQVVFSNTLSSIPGGALSVGTNADVYSRFYIVVTPGNQIVLQEDWRETGGAVKIKGYISQSPLKYSWNHIVLKYESNYGNIAIYINGRLSAGTTYFSNASATTLMTTNGTIHYNYLFVNSSPAIPGRYAGGITDILISSVPASPQEARRLFNFGTNSIIGYPNYPARIMSTRIAHYPLGLATDFQLISGNLHATDISGNNRHMQIFGQGTTPTLAPFY